MHKMLKLGYCISNMSASWPLIPWLFPSPGHQQLWYWLRRMHIFTVIRALQLGFATHLYLLLHPIIIHDDVRHQMEAFSMLLAICAGNSPVPGEFPSQRPVTRSFDVFFELRLNKRLSKQLWGWWIETQSLPLWRQCTDYAKLLTSLNTYDERSRGVSKCWLVIFCIYFPQCMGLYVFHWPTHVSMIGRIYLCLILSTFIRTEVSPIPIVPYLSWLCV